jgi:site-specific recombinase XerD
MSPAAIPATTETMRLLRMHGIHQERRGKIPQSVERTNCALRSFAHWLEPRTLLEATRDDVETFLDARRGRKEQSLDGKTRYLWLSNFHVFYTWAINEELTDRDPTLAIIRPKMRRNLPRPIADEDLALAMDEATPQMRAMLSLAAYQGFRCQEIAGLAREDILDTRDPALIVVVKAKGGYQRILPLHPQTLSALRCLPLPRSGALFHRPMGSPHTPASVSLAMRRYFMDLGVDATAHQLRHFFATGIYAFSKDIRLTQELLGHQNPDTTAIYVAWSALDAAPAVASLTTRPTSS